MDINQMFYTLKMPRIQNPFDIVQIFKSADSKVVKYIHHNGAETTIKTSATCVSADAGIDIDKGKAVLFISASTGCTQSCRFCFLTSKRMPFCDLDTDTIIKSAIKAIKKSKKQIKGKFLKISFMGMGDVFYSNTDINEIVKKVFLYAYKKGYIKGIDGVDIGTSFPASTNKDIYESIKKLKDTIRYLNINFNPYYNYTEQISSNPNERTPVRLFVSLHGVSDNVRFYLMPNTTSLDEILNDIKSLDIDIIFHYIMFKGLNDSKEDIDQLVKFFMENETCHYELRILRYNDNQNDLEESPHLDTAIEILQEAGVNFKYQISTGAEIHAACGQFICKITNKGE